MFRASQTALFNALRFAFRLTPMSQATRDRMRQRFLDSYGSLVPPTPRGLSGDGRSARRPYKRADERAIGYVPYAKGELPDPLPATLVAFYLPQFHTIPENDEWWGKGFTEWRNVTRALPQFEGHVQPRLPGDLGFYDLGNVQVMHEQARLAREYGIGAFCFYFYWFGGKTLLETPIRNWLADTSIDFPFCLCWANENWTRRWDGRSDEILIAQSHSETDDIAFITHISDYLRDPRYLRIDGKPILLVYRPGLLPDPTATTKRWRAWCVENGVGEIHIAYVQSFERPNPSNIGFDAAVEFPPNLTSSKDITAQQRLINPDFSGQVIDWCDMAEQCLRYAPNAYPTYAGVNPGWDNEARRPSNGRIFHRTSAGLYQDWLLKSIRKNSSETNPPPMIFINAWNEWAEGAILEPTAVLGYANLHATRQALCCSPQAIDSSALKYWALVHVWYFEAFDEILTYLGRSGLVWHVVVTTSAELEPKVRAALDHHGLSFDIFIVENRGRDILPFLKMCSHAYANNVDVVLKLHTKRSVHRDDGDLWRMELLEGLLGGSRAETILSTFKQDPKIGLVAPEGHLLTLNSYWGANEDKVRSLAELLGVSALPASSVFSSGSMFWVRLEAIGAIFAGYLYPSDFEEECGQIDGTLSHALERLFCAIVQSRKFAVESVASVCQEGKRKPSKYPFAS